MKSNITEDHTISSNKRDWEMYSSAFTMSDMELFIFPELLYSMVLANIISPRIWEWKKDPWFKEVGQMPLNKKLHRLKQYIMDNYTFNLDLDTWGLTTKEIEIERFNEFISMDALSESNALFGYEGDKYYFSIDIRKHFGLDKYNSNVIPYWKTETIEAMDAFKYKKHHKTGAGECVSLSALYAAAMFIVLNIPLEEIFIIGTPLHSQNFLTLGDGVLSNNRRILTKRMWYNGTILTDKARRALENENVTYVSHISGVIHTLYEEASINQNKYKKFISVLDDYLHIAIDGEILINFLRVNSTYRKYFQFQHKGKGQKFYITAEKLFEYEHNSKNRIDDTSRNKLLEEIDMDDFDLTQHQDRYIYNDLEKKLNKNKACCNNEESLDFWKSELNNIPVINDFITDLKNFACTKAKLPITNAKKFISGDKIDIPDSINTNREWIVEYLESKRSESVTANLTFFAGRYCKDKEWPYFIKASVERNPVSIQYFNNFSIEDVYNKLNAMDNDSIYGPGQYAQPDEVVNFERGDGLEKSITMANVLLAKNNDSKIGISASEKNIILSDKKNIYTFSSSKGLLGQFLIKKNVYEFSG